MDQYDDEVIALVNKHHEEAKRKSIVQNRIDYRNEQRATRIRYQTTKKKKMKGFAQNAILSIVAAATLIAAVRGISNEINKMNEHNDFLASISTEVKENTIYTDTRSQDNQGYTWYYDNLDDIADGVLNDNKEIDIDTRIYGTYASLKDYEKDEYMDKIMQILQSMVVANPEAYTADEIRACNNDSFASYLAQLGLDKGDYIDLMQNVTYAYSQNDTSKVEELLNKLTAGLNGGGR